MEGTIPKTKQGRGHEACMHFGRCRQSHAHEKAAGGLGEKKQNKMLHCLCQERGVG